MELEIIVQVSVAEISGGVHIDNDIVTLSVGHDSCAWDRRVSSVQVAGEDGLPTRQLCSRLNA